MISSSKRPMDIELQHYLEQAGTLINKALRKLLPKDNALLSRSMRYSLFAGGKRLRPVLVIAGAEICGGSAKSVLPAACALECIHTYSLIHDDLPAMDNDDLRRGMPTSHKKFGEAAAILTGDALLTDAFRLMTICSNGREVYAERIVKAIGVLSEASGYRGMVSGQVKDTLEANSWQGKDRRTLRRNLTYIHLNKTAALIQASLLVGAHIAGGNVRQIKALDIYGKNIGLAFQVTDDILDIVGDKKLLGKKGSDLVNNKLTYPSLYGLEQSRNMSFMLIKKAKEALAVFGKKAHILEKLADYIVERQY
jgi:geranylgeranyl diphosphate synthase type II